MLDAEKESKRIYDVPAVKSVPASWAVFKNSSRSRSCVIDCSREVESRSVVYYNASCKTLSTETYDGTHTMPVSRAILASLVFLLMIALPRPLGFGFRPLGACQMS